MEEKYTYFLVMYEDCSDVEHDYDVCDGIEEVADAIRAVEMDLDSSPIATVKIRGIGLSRSEYDRIKNDPDFELPESILNPSEELVY